MNRSHVLKIFLFFFIGTLISCSQVKKGANNCESRKAIFELGTNRIKMTTAEVDLCTKKILKVLSTESEPISFDVLHDLQQERQKLLTRQSMDSGLEVLKKLSDKASSQGISQENRVAIATGIFRKANNSQSFFDKIEAETKLKIKILSSLEEVLAAVEGIKKYQQATEFMVWDIGGESMQIGVIAPTTKPIYAVGLDGSQTIRKKFLPKFKTLAEGLILEKDLPRLEKAILANYAGSKFDEIKNSNPKIIYGIGGVHTRSILEKLQKLQLIPKEQKTFEITDVEKLLKIYLGQSKSEIQGPYAESQTLNLLLVHTLMKKMNIQKITASVVKPADIWLIEN